MRVRFNAPPMNQRRVTLADIAREANVHVTTVSLALRNNPRLARETVKRIREIATRLGYQPDPFLQALVAYRGNMKPRKNPPTLAYITNWDTCYGWKNVTAHPQFYAGAEAKATELGFRLDHFWLREPGMTHARLSRILETRGIHGLIIASHQREIDVALHLDWARFSAVKIDYFPHQPELHNVTNDQCSIVRLAMQRLMAAGYRRIGFVMHRGWDHSVDHLWTAGFLCEQSHLDPGDRIPMLLFPDLHPVEAWMNESNSHKVVPQTMLKRWLDEYQPEVIISKASFVEEPLAALGVRCPRDLSLVDVFLEDFSGKMAGGRQNHETVGALAIEILAGQLYHNKFGVPEIPTTTFVEGTWFDGASCPMPYMPKPRRAARAVLA